MQKNTKILGGILIIVVLGTILSFFVLFRDRLVSNLNGPVDYIIPGVPYYGTQNHVGDNSYVYGDTASSLASIINYWSPGAINLVDESRYFNENRKGLLTGEFIQGYVDYALKDSFTIRSEKLGIEDLKKYINPKTRTPLFLSISIDTNQPSNILYHPSAVLIGIKESEKKVVLHNYWLGNNYEISFDDFNKLWGNMRPDERNTYLIIQPIDLRGKINELSSRKLSDYPAKTAVMRNSEMLFKNYVMGIGAGMSFLPDEEIDYFNKVQNDSNFETYFPPIYRSVMYYELAKVYLARNDVDKALDYANKSVEIDHDLNKPFLDYPGFEVRESVPNSIDKMYEPYLILGDVYSAKGDSAKAMENYQKSIDIKPDNNIAAERLQMLKLASLTKQPATK